MRLILTSAVVLLSFLGPVHKGVAEGRTTPSFTFLSPPSLPFSPANALYLEGVTGRNSTPFVPFLDSVLAGFVHPVDSKKGVTGGNSTTCKRPATVEKFAASLYTAIILTQDPDVFTALELPGKKAAKAYYPIVYKALNKEKDFDAEGLARNATQAVAKIGTLTLVKYVEKMAYNIGEFLIRVGLLDCSNAVRLAFEYFEFVRYELDFLDTHLFEHHMHGICQGLVNFIHAHDLTLCDIEKELAPVFH